MYIESERPASTHAHARARAPTHAHKRSLTHASAQVHMLAHMHAPARACTRKQHTSPHSHPHKCPRTHTCARPDACTHARAHSTTGVHARTQLLKLALHLTPRRNSLCLNPLHKCTTRSCTANWRVELKKKFDLLPLTKLRYSLEVLNIIILIFRNLFI